MSVHYRDFAKALEQQVSLYNFYNTDVGKNQIIGANQQGWTSARADIARLFGSRSWKYTRTLLKAATPVYISRDITEILHRAQATLDPELTLRPEFVPAKQGFAYFDGPGVPMLRTPTEVEGEIRGVGWSYLDVPVEKGGGTEQVCMIFTFGPAVVPGKPTSVDRLWQLLSVDMWSFGETWTDTAYAANHPEVQASDWSLARMQAGRWLTLSLFLFMRQKLVVRRTESIDRPWRRRLEREGWEHQPNIEIIEFRRKNYLGHPDDGYTLSVGPVPWSCSWTVRWHWHTYHTKNGPEPRLIEPYVKGDPDKPLKNSEKLLFAVVQ